MIGHLPKGAGKCLAYSYLPITLAQGQGPGISLSPLPFLRPVQYRIISLPSERVTGYFSPNLAPQETSGSRVPDHSGLWD